MAQFIQLLKIEKKHKHARALHMSRPNMQFEFEAACMYAFMIKVNATLELGVVVEFVCSV